MSFIKILLIALGLILFGMIAFPIIAFVWHALWYVFWISILGLGGYIGYKWLHKNSETNRLGSKTPYSIGGLDDVNSAFEEFKRKHLTK